jgi:hypothetical protein
VTKHIIVDGSNIATEGRTEPSLAQLDEAVTALMAEYKGSKVTVIVDATFGHRIAKKERAEFESAIANNELVAPPAGAVGRGDAFILAIADKANAAILSNDSYQEFHGKYKWLFDEGRLIGGKPVPLVGWVFVERLPVRGPTSRQSIRTGKVVKKQQAASPEASKPMPVPKAPPPNARLKAQPAAKQEPTKQNPEKRAKKKRAKEKKALAKPAVMANDVVPYLEFVEKHPVGTKVKAVVQSYAANGVSVTIGNVAGYVPLRNMASPIPRSARDVFKIGDAATLTVVGYTPARRSVDLGVPDVVAPLVANSSSKASAKPAAKKVAPAKKAPPAKKPVAKAVVSEVKKPAKKAVVKKAVAPKPAVKKPAKKAVVKKAVAKKATSKKTAVKKAVAKKK